MFTKKKQQKGVKKFNPTRVLLETNDPNTRELAANQLVTRCFEQAFGKNFFPQETEAGEDEVQKIKYHLKA